MKKRKLLIALLCGALVCLPLAGCNNKNGASGTDSSVQSEAEQLRQQSGIYKRCVCHGYLYDTDRLWRKCTGSSGSGYC